MDLPDGETTEASSDLIPPDDAFPPEEWESKTLAIDPERFVWRLALACFGIEILLFWADAVINYGRLTEIGAVRRFFNTAREDAFASWFSVTQTWMVGLTVAAIYIVVRRTSQSRRRRAGWLVLSGFFLYLALDDGSELHERAGSTFKAIVGKSGKAAGEASEGIAATLLGVFPSYTWQLLFLPIFGTLGIFMLVFLWRELRRPKLWWLIAAAAGLMVVAVGFDFLEGMDLDNPWNAHTWIMRDWDLTEYDVRHFSKSFEEVFEMMAMTLLWSVFLLQLFDEADGLEIRVKRDFDEAA